MPPLRTSKAFLLDGYVDEPTALGVPPYLSPYPRYVAGMLACHGLEVTYFTADQWRDDPAIGETLSAAPPSALLVAVAGLTVPGHYKGGTPLSFSELTAILSTFPGTAVVGGPIRHGYTLTGGTRAMPLPDLLPALLARGDLDAFVSDLLETGTVPGHRYHSFSEVSHWAPAGAFLARHHPGFPSLIAEIETARGCERPSHCSFCTEGLYPTPQFRAHQDIVAEVQALHAAGLRHFRLGKQPNLFAWPGRTDRTGRILPDPPAIAALYRDLRTAAPGLKTLHLDNVNPAFVAAFPDECLDIAMSIAHLNTPGDVAALGLETADPDVAARNHLKCSAAQALAAVEIINRAGAARQPCELPRLLPGINLLHGLPGESAATYDLNYRFLKDVAARGLLLRRINIRQVMVFPETPLAAALQGRGPRINKARFRKWKDRIQEEIERPMLRQVAPAGTVLHHVVTEFHDGDVTFGRQLASYPLLTGIPMRLPLRTALDVFVVDHGYRSVTALPLPLNVNTAPPRALQAIPGLGERRTARILAARPFSSLDQLLDCLDEPAVVTPYLEYLALTCRQ